MPSTIGTYYRAAVEEARKEIESTPDERVIGLPPEEWVDYLVTKWGMVEVELDSLRETAMSEIEREY